MILTIILLSLIFLCKEGKNRKLSASIPSCYVVKYIAALSILWYHLIWEIKIIDNSFLLMESAFGPKAVSVFFFLSGYGLMHGFVTKKQTYLKNFLTHRLTKIVIPLVTAYFFFFVCQYVTGNKVSFVDAFERLLSFNPYLPFSWYVSEIVLLYVLFYLVARFSKHFLLTITAGVLLMITSLIALGADWYWTVSTPAFIMGLYYRQYEVALYDVIDKTKRYCLPILLAVFFCSFNWVRIYNATQIEVIKDISIIYPFIANMAFVIVLFYALARISYNRKSADVFRSSYELYIVSGGVILLSSMIQNALIAFIASIISCVVIAYAFYRLNQFISKRLL